MNHERLHCYQKLKVLLRDLIELSQSFPRGCSELRDQLKRAAISAMLNLAEGNVRKSQKERSRFFEISLGSIAEIAACIDIIRLLKIITEAQETSYKESLRICYAQIKKLP